MAKHTPLIQWISNISLVSYGDIEFRSEFCLPPCLVLSFHASRAPTVTSSKVKNQSAIDLYFQETIEIKKIVLAYDATSLLVEVGSCLGLWLGLSVVGLFDTCTVIMANIKWIATGYFKLRSSAKLSSDPCLSIWILCKIFINVNHMYVFNFFSEFFWA